MEIRHPQWTPLIKVKGLDKDTIYFNFRLYIAITNLNDMFEFVPVTEHMKDKESKISMTANCLLSVLDIIYITNSLKCV